MNILRRIKNITLGFIFMGVALGISLYLLSILFVIVNFAGNASFPAECAVVFGSAVRGGDKAGPGITRRVETAVHLLEEGSVERLFFTGGKGEGNLESEAAVMRSVAIKRGVAPEKITIEEQATSTWENIQFVQPSLTDCESVVGISDRYHLARIRLTSWLLDVPMQIYPAEREANFAFEVMAVLRESLGIVAYVGLGIQRASL